MTFPSLSYLPFCFSSNSPSLLYKFLSILFPSLSYLYFHLYNNSPSLSYRFVSILFPSSSYLYFHLIFNSSFSLKISVSLINPSSLKKYSYWVSNSSLTGSPNFSTAEYVVSLSDFTFPFRFISSRLFFLLSLQAKTSGIKSNSISFFISYILFVSCKEVILP